jgi:Domain of unknown function (DUF6484)
MSESVKLIDGVIIGLFLGQGDTGPLVVFPGNPDEHALTARSVVPMTSDMIGAEVALMFQDGDPRRPLIIGRVLDPSKSDAAHVVRDGQQIKVTANERLELRCGKGSIVMEKDGHITIRGTYLISHASATNRILGGSVNLN